MTKAKARCLTWHGGGEVPRAVRDAFAGPEWFYLMHGGPRGVPVAAVMRGFGSVAGRRVGPGYYVRYLDRLEDRTFPTLEKAKAAAERRFGV